MKKQKLTIYLDEALVRQLKKEAKSRTRSVNNYISWLVSDSHHAD